MLANWSNTVINIKKRDEALSNFQQAVEGQKTELKNVKATIEGTKTEIVTCQGEHEMLTGIIQRMKTFCDTKDQQIKRNQKETSEGKLELGRLSSVRAESEASLKRIEDDARILEKESDHIKSKILQLEFERQGLDTKMFESLRDQMSNEKSVSEAEKQIKTLKEEIATVDSKLKLERNRLVDLDKKIEATKIKQVMEQHRRDGLALQTQQLEEEERKVEDALRTTTYAIEKVQNLINHAEKEFSELR